MLKDRQALSRATLVHLRGVLKRALRWGQKHDRVGERNVAELADIPESKKRRQGKSLTVVQAKKVIELAQAERMVNGQPWREPLEALFLIGITRPSRPGELLGLPWSAIDFENERIHFTQALHHAKDGSLYLGPLKNDWSRRWVDVDPFVMEALKRRRKAQLEDKMRLPAGITWGAGWQTTQTNSGLDPDLVFTNGVGGPLDMSNVRRSFSKLLKRAGVPGSWTTYELRHSAVSIMSNGGVSIEDIADYSGHKNSNVTRTVYRHNISPTVTAAKGVTQNLFAAKEETS
jgi:integrase